MSKNINAHAINNVPSDLPYLSQHIMNPIMNMIIRNINTPMIIK